MSVEDALKLLVGTACAFEVVALVSRNRIPTLSRLLGLSGAAASFTAGALWMHWIQRRYFP